MQVSRTMRETQIRSRGGLPAPWLAWLPARLAPQARRLVLGSLERDMLMATIPTTSEERRAYFTALGRAGGTATYARFGSSYMATLGKQGFRVTLGRYGGDFVWRLLRESYLRKFPDRDGPRRRTTVEARAKVRLRAKARRLYPIPQLCVDCGEPGTQRDHVHGVLAGNASDNIAWRCDRCHSRKTRIERQECWGTAGASPRGPGR